MHAGQESYRDGYEPVREVSQQYSDAMAKVDRHMALWQLMNLLAKSPAAAVVGRLHRRDHKVHFGRKMAWSLGGKAIDEYAVPEQAVRSAVARLRKVLEENGIMYAVWVSSPMGNKKSKKGGKAVQVSDFTVGLVRIRERIKLSRYSGKKVEPGS